MSFNTVYTYTGRMGVFSTLMKAWIRQGKDPIEHRGTGRGANSPGFSHDKSGWNYTNGFDIQRNSLIIQELA